MYTSKVVPWRGLVVAAALIAAGCDGPSPTALPDHVADVVSQSFSLPTPQVELVPATEILAGPFVVTRGTGAPTTESFSITVPDRGAFTETVLVKVEDVSPSGKVSDGTVKLGDAFELVPSNFPLKAGVYEADVALGESATLDVELGGKPGSALRITIIGTFKPGYGRVGPDGGAIFSADGRARLTVPAGALDGAQIISVTHPLEAPAANDVFGWVGAPVVLEPEGLIFNLPATLRVWPLTDASNVEDVVIWFVDQSRGALDWTSTWVAEDDALAVETLVEHFSVWIPSTMLPVLGADQAYTYAITGPTADVPEHAGFDVDAWFAHWDGLISGVSFRPAAAGEVINFEVQFDRNLKKPLGERLAGKAYFRCALALPLPAYTATCAALNLVAPRRGVIINPGQAGSSLDEFFVKSPSLAYTTTYETGLHETGHTLGLRHFPNSCNIPWRAGEPACYSLDSGHVMAPFGFNAAGPMVVSMDDVEERVDRLYDVDRQRNVVTGLVGTSSQDIGPIALGSVRDQVEALLPQVRVTSSSGEGVSGVVVGFVAGPGSSVVDAVAVTGADGLASPGDWVLETEGVHTLSAVIVGPAPYENVYRRVTVSFAAEAVSTPSSLNEQWADGNYTSNPVWVYSKSPGAVQVGSATAQIIDEILEFLRTGAGSRGGGQSLTTAVSLPASDALRVGFDVQVASHSLGGGGSANTEYPAYVVVFLTQANGAVDRLVFAYSTNGGQDKTVIAADGGVWRWVVMPNAPAGQWLRNQNFRIRDFNDTGVRVDSVQVAANGWNVHSYFDNIRLPADAPEYGLFEVTEAIYPRTTDMNQVCRETYGPEYRNTDWWDVEQGLASGITIDQILPADLNHAWTTHYGTEYWSGDRRFFMSRYPPHSGYLVHYSLNANGTSGGTPVVVMGSWNSSYRVSCTRWEPPVPEPGLLFADSFSGDLSAWYAEHGQGTAAIVNGGLELDYNIGCGSTGCHQMQFLLDDAYQPGNADFRIEVKSKLVQAYCCYNGGAIGNLAKFALWTSDSEKEHIDVGWGWQGLVAPTEMTVVHASHSKYPWSRVGYEEVDVPMWNPHEAQTVVLERRGDVYTLFFNGQQVYQVTRTFSSPPKVGLSTYGRVRMDDFKLYVLP